MTTHAKVSNALLWAAAVVAAAVLEAPDTLTLMILPTLAGVWLIVASTRSPAHACSPRVGVA